MATGLTISITSRLDGTYEITNATGTTVVATMVPPQVSKDFTYGGGALQCNWVFNQQYTIAAAGNQDLDFYGVLTDLFGTTINAATLKHILVVNTSSVSGYFGAFGATNPIASAFNADVDGTITLGELGWVEIGNPAAAGFTVTNGSADNLRIHNSGGSNMVVNVFAMGD